MQIAKALAALCLVVFAHIAPASEPPLTGAFSSTGRVCSGGVYVRARTIQWISAFRLCKPTPYEVIDKVLVGDRQRIAYRLSHTDRQCPYEVIELEEVGQYAWTVNGYQSAEAYWNRDLPAWAQSPLPERQPFSCPLTRRN